MGGIGDLGYYDFRGALAFKEPSRHFDHLSFRSDHRSFDRLPSQGRKAALALGKGLALIRISDLCNSASSLCPAESPSKCWWWKRRNKLSHLRLGWTYVNGSEHEFKDGLYVGRAAAGHCDGVLAAALAEAISENSIQSAPAGLAASGESGVAQGSALIVPTLSLVE
jgi:hypothetical protein